MQIAAEMLDWPDCVWVCFLTSTQLHLQHHTWLDADCLKATAPSTGNISFIIIQNYFLSRK